MRYPDRVNWDRVCQLEGWNRGQEEDRIEPILITPMATGVGGASGEKWAAQFVLALKHYVDAMERPERWRALGWREIDEEVSQVEKTYGM